MFRDRSPLSRDNLNNSNSESSSLNNINMPNPATLSYSDIQCRFNFAKCMVPEYFGGAKDLSYFLNSSKEFLDKFTFTDQDLNRYFLQYVISQIKGDARDLIALNHPKTFDEVKTLLLNKYRDPSSEENLLTSLTTSFQNNNQNFEEFALEINHKLHKLKENAQIEYSNNNDLLKLKYSDYDRQALYSFVSGLKEPYCSFVRQQNPTNLDACISICRDYDNIQTQINYKNFLRQNMSKKNNFRNSNGNNFQNSNFNNIQRPSVNQNYNGQQTSYSNTFPRGPVDVFNSRPQHRNFNNNNNNNANNKPNVFKPRYNTDHLPKPTPMSTTSRFTSQLNNNRHNFQSHGYNHFARQGPARPGVIVEEIHNVEEDSPEDFEQNFQVHPSFQEST